MRLSNHRWHRAVFIVGIAGLLLLASAGCEQPRVRMDQSSPLEMIKTDVRAELAADAAAKAGMRITITLPESRQTSPSASQIRQLAEYATAEPAFIEAFLSLPASDVDDELFGVLLSVLRTALSTRSAPHNTGFSTTATTATTSFS